jgi:peptidyl-prolyl cis-trans isomerase C
MPFGIATMGEAVDMSKRALAGTILALVAVLGVASCGGGQSSSGTSEDDSGRVLATVAGTPVTEQDLEEELQNIPSHSRGQYQGVTGRQRLLDQVITRKLIRLEALDLGLDEDPQLVKRMADFEERLLTDAWNRYLLESLPEPTEEELQAYFDAHSDEFVVQARVNASWMLLPTREAAEQARQRVLQGEKFTVVAREVNTDECTKADGGLLGYFSPDGYVRCIGKKPEFNARAFAMEAGDISEPFPWDDEWALLRVHEKTTERPMPYRKARERIQARLRPTVTDSLLEAHLASLRAKFDVENNYSPEVELAGKSADDLMRLATEASDPRDKITYYEVLLGKYPQYDRADEAQFMIGFVYSEELRDKEKARDAFQAMLNNYPDSQIRDSASYMLQNLEKLDMPTFEKSAPENVDGPSTP